MRERERISLSETIQPLSITSSTCSTLRLFSSLCHFSSPFFLLLFFSLGPLFLSQANLSFGFSLIQFALPLSFSLNWSLFSASVRITLIESVSELFLLFNHSRLEVASLSPSLLFFSIFSGSRHSSSLPSPAFFSSPSPH